MPTRTRQESVTPAGGLRAPLFEPTRPGAAAWDAHRERGNGDLASLSSVSRDTVRTVERVLASAREQLGMDIAYVSAFRDGQQAVDAIGGDHDAFGLEPGTSFPLEETICQFVISGDAPEVIPDTREQEHVRDLDAVKQGGIGSYAGVPLRFSDGSTYGMLCCVGRAADDSLGERDARFLHVLARLVADQLEREQLELEKRRLEIEATGAHALLAALDARDDYTCHHSEEVVGLARMVAGELRLSDRETTEVEQVALLHDIGKVGIPDAILRKPGPLDEDEWEVMRRHPAIGERMIRSIEGLEHLGPAIRAEHERWDGRGYPDGLAGEEIPLASRITFACDAYHAMTSDRPYRKALEPAVAEEEMRRNAGTQFCPRTVDALLAALGEPSVEGAVAPAPARGDA